MVGAAELERDLPFLAVELEDDMEVEDEEWSKKLFFLLSPSLACTLLLLLSKLW